MIYREHAPPPDLADEIWCVWTLQGDPRGGGGAAPGAAWDRALPDGSSEIVINRADPFEAGWDGATGARQPGLLWVGATSRALFLRPTGVVDLVGIRLRPGGAACFTDVPQDRLADAWWEADGPAPALGRGLRAVIGSSGPTFEAKDVARVHDVLRGARRQRVDPRLVRVRAAVEEAAVTVDHLAGVACASARTLQRVFREQVGMSPKRYLRIRRFQRVVGGGGSADELLRRAFRAGYYDFPHLARDFRELAATSPGAFLELDEDTLARTFLSGLPGGGPG